MQGSDQSMDVAEIEKDDRDIFLKQFYSFEDTAIGIAPKVKQGGPMKEERGQEFGIDFGQNAPRVLTVPFIKGEIFFPEFEEELDLPTNFEQEQSFFERKQGCWDVRQDDSPFGQVQQFFGRLATMFSVR